MTYICFIESAILSVPHMEPLSAETQEEAMLEAADLMKMEAGIAASFIRLIISCRPRAQVVSRVKAKKPINSGNQPPSGTLIRFAAK